MKRTSTAWILFAATILLEASTVFAMGEAPKDELVSIGGMQFVVPSGYKALYDENTQSIKLMLDADTLDIPRKGDANPSMKKIIEVFITEDGNDPYGTPPFASDLPERDDYFGCSSFQTEHKEYEFCQYDIRQETIDLWGKNVYVLREKGQDIPILLIGCVDAKKTTVHNPTCEGRALMSGNIRIRSIYSVENLNNAFEIDQAMRGIVNNFHNLATETRNVVHTDPE